MAKYNQLTKKDLAFLVDIVGRDRAFLGESMSQDYGKDELGTVQKMPDIVLQVTGASEIQKVMQFAYSQKISVTVRGSGTGLVGACVPLYGGIVLDTTKMNRILELDEENMCLTVEPGVLLMDIYEYVEPKGYFYAPDPGEKTATIGGNIATNAGGMRAVRYGVTRDWVQALEVVLPNGEIVELGRKVVKNATGYSLLDLIIGSEGTLGIITKAVLKLTSKPVEAISILAPFNTLDEALNAVPKIIQSKSNPIAIEFFERVTVLFAEEYLGKKFPDTKSNYYLLLTFDGMTKEIVTHAYKEAADLLLDELGAQDVFIVDTDERKESVWKARGAFLEAIKGSTTQMDECDVVVPRSEIAEFLKFTYTLQEKHGLRIASFGHAGDGNLHIYLCRDDLSEEEFARRLDLAFNDLYQQASLVGGLVSGEHGIGFAKKQYMEKTLGETQIKLMQGIKDFFDPLHILNPGKIVY